MKTTFIQETAKVFIKSIFSLPRHESWLTIDLTHDTRSFSIVSNDKKVAKIVSNVKKVAKIVSNIKKVTKIVSNDKKVTKTCRAKRNREVLDFSKKSSFRWKILYFYLKADLCQIWNMTKTDK